MRLVKVVVAHLVPRDIVRSVYSEDRYLIRKLTPMKSNHIFVEYTNLPSGAERSGQADPRTIVRREEES